MSKVAILSYHKIGHPPPPPKGWDSWYYVTAEGFEQQLLWLRDHDYQFISRDDLYAALDGAALPPKAALITFDDGYRNNLTVALPVMKRLAVPGIVFVPTHYVNGLNAWDIANEPEEPICSWDELLDLERNGVAIESHSVTHPSLSSLTVEQQEHELRESKAILESGLNRAVELFAYPYGDWGRDETIAADLLKKVGYRAGCLYGGGAVKIPGANRWRLERLAMGPDSNLAKMLGEAEPGGGPE